MEQKMRQKQVIQAWLQGNTAKSTTNSLSSDGRYLYSYSLPIARYSWSDDKPVVWNYSAKDGGDFISHTTSKHINITLSTIRESGMEPLMELPHDH